MSHCQSVDYWNEPAIHSAVFPSIASTKFSCKRYSTITRLNHCQPYMTVNRKYITDQSYLWIKVWLHDMVDRLNAILGVPVPLGLVRLLLG